MSPKSKEQFDEMRQKSRAKIMEVALELFAQRGYHHTSISQIAKAADISKGLIYNYFESKEALLRDIVMEAVSQFDDIEAVLQSMEGTATQKLRWVTETAIETVLKDVKHWRLLTSLGLQTDVLTSLKEALRAKTENAFALSIALFKEMGFDNPKQEAYIYGALLDGMVLHYVSMTQLDMEYPLEEMKQFIFKRYNL